ncbi:MAG: threonine/serine dehydratase [Oscillospiraceae bacterium]|nr:threonine/serine dehydratase [Oscillospiraceae bacterium]
MPVTIETIREAQERISPYSLRTPCLRLNSLDEFLGCQVYVKAECMQITGAFKLRGALNKLLSLPREQLQGGVVAASSGNHGRAVAYGAKLLGASAAIVMPRTAPGIKIDGIRSLGAEVVLCDVSQRFRVAEELCRERNAAMVPPFNDPAVMAGQGTAGIELVEQCPPLDMVVVPVSGGSLLGGVSAAVKALSPETRVFGAEPEALPRYSASLSAGGPVTVERHATVADALASDTPGSLCFPLVQKHADGVVPVDDAFTLRGMKLLLLEGKLLAEPSSCIGIGAVLQGRLPVSPGMKVCFLISGGNVGLDQLDLLK